MKKITIMGIAVGAVLAVGIFSNIGLFGNNALANKPTTEQKITTIFRFITNPEFGLKEIKNEVRAIEEDLLQKKSFYEVEHEVVLYYMGGVPPVTINGAVTISLGSCDDSIPLENRAFSLLMLNVQMGNDNSGTEIDFTDVFIDTNYELGDSETGTLTNTRKAIAFEGEIGASDQIQYTYVAVLVGADATNGLPFKAVAIGQQPQGCTITVVADDTIDEPDPFPDA